MAYDIAFRTGSIAALSGWILLAVLPHWRGIAGTMAGIVIPGLLAMAYAGLVLAYWSGTRGGFGSLDEVAALFQTRGVLLAGWLHYLAFDLVVGAWEVREARRAGMRHWTILPALFLTFMFGPAGYLLFLAQRGGRALRADAAPAQPANSGVPTPQHGWADRIRARLAIAEPHLFAAALVLLIAMAPTVVAQTFDQRSFGGEPIWLKPLRFELALALFLATLAWLYGLAGPGFGATRLGRFVIWGAIGTSFFEALYIAFQAGRGMASHFNHSSPLYEALYGLMGLGALILTATAPALAWGIVRNNRATGRTTLRPLDLAVVIGLVLTFALGVPEGAIMGASQSHLVGALPVGALPAASAPSLPLFGWSRMFGDLRPAHFMGIHAQQIIPVFGALAAALLAPDRARRAIVGFSALYVVATVLLLVEALAGRPLFPA